MNKKSCYVIQIMALIMTVLLLFWQAPSVFAAEKTADTQTAYNDTCSLLTEMAESAGWSPDAIWIVLSLARAGKLTDAQAQRFAAGVVDALEAAGGTGKLSENQSSDNSKTAMALTAAGFDVRNVGGFDLLEPLADLAYISKQGMNGPIWALLAFDSGNYEIPTFPVSKRQVTREGLVTLILNMRKSDHGWAYSGSSSDVDMTCMALQALAPYYGSNENVTVAVDEALEWLSSVQKEDGSFSSVNVVTSESASQVIVALTTLGIDPETDAAFSKSGYNVLDSLLSFYVDGGGFKHIESNYKSNGLASVQGLYALVAYYRFREGRSALYQMADAAGAYPIAPIEPSAAVYTGKLKNAESATPTGDGDRSETDGSEKEIQKDDGKASGGKKAEDSGKTSGDSKKTRKTGSTSGKNKDTKKTDGTSGKSKDNKKTGGTSEKDKGAKNTDTPSGKNGGNTDITDRENGNRDSNQEQNTRMSVRPSAGQDRVPSGVSQSGGVPSGNTHSGGTAIPAKGQNVSDQKITAATSGTGQAESSNGEDADSEQMTPAIVLDKITQTIDQIMPNGSDSGAEETRQYEDGEIRLAADACSAYLKLDETGRAVVQKDPQWKKFCSLTEQMGKQLHYDAASGVSLVGNTEEALPWYIQVIVVEKEPEAPLLESLMTAVGDDGNLQNLYDIRFINTLDMTAWEPEQILTFSMPVTANAASGQSLLVLHVKKDGGLEFLEGEVSDGEENVINCQADEFSTYGVVCINGSLDDLLSGMKQEKKPISLRGGFWWLIAGCLIGAGAAIVVCRKYYYERKIA